MDDVEITGDDGRSLENGRKSANEDEFNVMRHEHAQEREVPSAFHAQTCALAEPGLALLALSAMVGALLPERPESK